MRVFVTGTAGFIGFPLAGRLRDADQAVAGVAGVGAALKRAGHSDRALPGRSRETAPFAVPPTRAAVACGP